MINYRGFAGNLILCAFAGVCANAQVLWRDPPPRKRDAQQFNGDAGFGAFGGELP